MEIGTSTSFPTLPSLSDARVTQPVPPAAPVGAAIDKPVPQAAAPVPPSDDKPGNDVRQNAPVPTDVFRRQITVDQETHKVVYQAVDTRTGDVVYQLPDIRYLKAYAEQIKASDLELARSNVERLA